MGKDSKVVSEDYGSPNMSDTTLLVSVEDLINMAMGPTDQNVVNFKLVQTILHILARQMRLLEQRVEIRITDEHEHRGSHSHKMADIKEHRGRSSDTRLRGRDDSRPSKDRDVDKHTERAEKAARANAKEIEKAERAAFKEKEKAERAASKDRDKAERAVSKERDKAERAAAKEAERADRAASKDRETAERDAEKEEIAASKEKADKHYDKEKGKAASKDKEKADKAASKDKEKAARAASRERERADKDAEKGERGASKDREKAEKDTAKGKEKKGKGKVPSETSIVVSEVERRKEKVLVVEKGPTTRVERSRDSIEVVTRSRFDIVEAMVKDLQKRAGPLPPPAFPDNEKLRSDLVKGQASLTDTMKAMQVTARISAAEQAIGRMGDILTQLAAAGALPEEMADQLGDVKFDTSETRAEVETDTFVLPSKMKSQVSRKSVAIDPVTMPSQASQASIAPRAPSRASMARQASATSRASVASSINLPGVTHPEMDEAIRTLREDLTKNVGLMTTKATSIAENANASAKAVSDKLEIALKLDNRISTLYALTSDYAEQLSGFDSGLTTQMQSFRDQMAQMSEELNAGLKQLEMVNNNAETAAVLELTERYDGLVTELDHAMHAHRGLTTFQRQLSVQLNSLVECVEMLREQKADRDEVLDGLRDKADNARLAGLLTSIEFASARLDLEKRLDVCHDKFRRQEHVWMTALKDLTVILEQKAEMTQLLAARDKAEDTLRELQRRQTRLLMILGEPKAAMLTRALAVGANCGSCLTPALMEPQDASYGAPPPLPALLPRDKGKVHEEAEPCLPDWRTPELPDQRDHTCHRWVGGSHTLLSDAITRERAPPIALHTAPTRKYTGYGDDNRLYMLEEELQPCLECNKFSEDAPAEGAGGDQGPTHSTAPTST